MTPDQLTAEQCARAIAEAWPELYHATIWHVRETQFEGMLWEHDDHDHISLDALAPVEASMLNDGWYRETWHLNKLNVRVRLSNEKKVVESTAPTEPLARARALIKARQVKGAK